MEGRQDAPTCRRARAQRQPGSLLKVFFRFLEDFFFDFHVSEFVGVEYLAAVQTFNVFDIFFTRYDAYLRVFAGGVHRKVWL